MRISDWSSDVCSSDLQGKRGFEGSQGVGHRGRCGDAIEVAVDRDAAFRDDELLQSPDEEEQSQGDPQDRQRGAELPPLAGLDRCDCGLAPWSLRPEMRSVGKRWVGPSRYRGLAG